MRESFDTRRAAVGRMTDAMIHRGPDGEGIASQDEATFGSRRLAVFDPANGEQPMTTPDGRYLLVFNGAIYNFRELALQLETLGWVFKTQCDTEVLLAAFAEWHTDCLTRLRGMFAFAVWDKVTHRLVLARGPLGIKPLYYHWSEWSRLVEDYERQIPCYYFRHLVKPGITGWAQVNYPYGANLDDTLRKLEYDLYYIRHFSFTLDASIVLKTIHIMLFGKGR